MQDNSVDYDKLKKILLSLTDNSTLPEFVKIEELTALYAGGESTDSKPPSMKATLKKNGYTAFSGWLYSSKIKMTEAEAFIRGIRFDAPTSSQATVLWREKQNGAYKLSNEALYHIRAEHLKNITRYNLFADGDELKGKVLKQYDALEEAYEKYAALIKLLAEKEPK